MDRTIETRTTVKNITDALSTIQRHAHLPHTPLPAKLVGQLCTELKTLQTELDHLTTKFNHHAHHLHLIHASSTFPPHPEGYDLLQLLLMRSLIIDKILTDVSLADPLSSLPTILKSTLAPLHAPKHLSAHLNLTLVSHRALSHTLHTVNHSLNALAASLASTALKASTLFASTHPSIPAARTLLRKTPPTPAAMCVLERYFGAGVARRGVWGMGDIGAVLCCVVGACVSVKVAGGDIGRLGGVRRCLVVMWEREVAELERRAWMESGRRRVKRKESTGTDEIKGGDDEDGAGEEEEEEEAFEGASLKETELRSEESAAPTQTAEPGPSPVRAEKKKKKKKKGGRKHRGSGGK